ncbi:MAG TPA: hypothetical protein DEB07_06115, partial [Candidatus Moranbacteria bacterium]|nr:hypothetical protein [Candidatus Moranbacteria bacterium]
RGIFEYKNAAAKKMAADTTTMSLFMFVRHVIPLQNIEFHSLNDFLKFSMVIIYELGLVIFCYYIGIGKISHRSLNVQRNQERSDQSEKGYF